MTCMRVVFFYRNMYLFLQELMHITIDCIGNTKTRRNYPRLRQHIGERGHYLEILDRYRFVSIYQNERERLITIQDFTQQTQNSCNC